MSDHESDIKKHLLGAWRLVTWEQIHEDGTNQYPLGPDAVGQLMYTPEDRVSAQLVRAGQPWFANDDWQAADAEEMQAAWPSYFGYFGRFSIDLDRGAVIHHVEGSWFPNLVGTDQTRRYAIDGDRLTLDADTAWGTVRIVWHKLR
jgi:hypothetical protein